MNLSSKILSVSLLLTSFLVQSQNYKQVTSTSKLFKVSVKDVLGHIDKSTESINNPVKCVNDFQKAYQVLYNFDSKEANLPGIADNELTELVTSSFNLRLKIKDKLKDLDINHSSGEACLSSIKEIVKALRYVEDYFIEYQYKRSGRDQEEFITLAGKGIHFLKSKDYNLNDYNDLKSGDILITRGNAYSSAAIARIGLDDYQFSHMSLIYRDVKDALYTSEAHIEIGSVNAPIQVHLDQNNARTIVFRHKDFALAKRASKFTFNHIKEHKKNHGFNIEYDFGMDLSSNSRLFCTEVAYVGYLNAAKEMYGEALKIPLYKTKFDEKHLKFLNEVGIAVNDSTVGSFETFGPGDIQFDSRFEMIAEWRDPTKLKDTRFKDAILTKLFEWMDKENYYFKTSFGNKLKNNFAWLMRRTKLTSSLFGLKNKFPLNMKVHQMNLFVNLDVVGEILYQELERNQLKSMAPLTFKELYNILEDFRVKDFALYKKKKRKAKFHRIFHKMK